MFFRDIDIFRQKLRDSSLPGIQSHLKLSPVTRKFATESNGVPARQSAVLILFYPVNNIIHLALILRPVDNTVHSGQVAFPGGSVEPEDADIVSTALREANEEVGIIQNDVNVIGQLSKLYIPPSNFDVYPIVGTLDYTPDFICNNEVDKLLQIPWKSLIKPEILTEKKIIHHNTSIKVPCYYIQDNIIWGATSMIISELIDVLVG